MSDAMQKLSDKDCQRCGKDYAILGERYCSICKKLVLKQIRADRPKDAYAQISESRGRKTLRLRGDMDSGDYDNGHS